MVYQMTNGRRMDMIYHSLSLMFEDKLFFAPVKNPQRIADMATGTGIWAIDVGDKYEGAEGLPAPSPTNSPIYAESLLTTYSHWNRPLPHPTQLVSPIAPQGHTTPTRYSPPAGFPPTSNSASTTSTKTGCSSTPST